MGLLLWAGYRLVLLLVDALEKLEPTVVAAIVAASGTVTVSVASVLITKAYERRQEHQRKLWEKKAKLYQPFLEAFFTQFGLGNSELQGNQQEFVDLVKGFNREILLWGGDDAVKRWSSFRTSATANDKPHVAMAEFARLVLAMRVEFGHRNKEVDEAVILRTFINDYDSYMAAQGLDGSNGPKSEIQPIPSDAGGTGAKSP